MKEVIHESVVEYGMEKGDSDYKKKTRNNNTYDQGKAEFYAYIGVNTMQSIIITNVKKVWITCRQDKRGMQKWICTSWIRKIIVIDVRKGTEERCYCVENGLCRFQVGVW